MSDVRVETDPQEVGFDAKRLGRIETHFDQYVADGRIPGWSVLVSRAGKVAYLATSGKADMESGLPVTDETLFRIFSMTKPVTTVAAMMLYEEGRFELNDPVSKFIPSFGQCRIFSKGTSLKPVLVPAQEELRIWHLMTHTSGLTYGFHYAHPVDAIYRANGFEWVVPPGIGLADACDRYAEMPLLFEPGSEWNYSVATDVLGRVVEVISGMTLDRFFHERIFTPLGMDETSFHVLEKDHDRLATLYAPFGADRKASRFDLIGEAIKKEPRFLSGGGGLASTVSDYHRFTQMLANKGRYGEARLLGSRTVDYMTKNHIPGNGDLHGFGRPLFAETSYIGVGFGLGFSVVIDSAANKVLTSKGEFAWGGAASTAFWVDPKEEITAIFMTQVMPSSTHPLRTQLRQLVYQALVD